MRNTLFVAYVGPISDGRQVLSKQSLRKYVLNRFSAPFKDKCNSWDNSTRQKRKRQIRSNRSCRPWNSNAAKISSGFRPNHRLLVTLSRFDIRIDVVFVHQRSAGVHKLGEWRKCILAVVLGERGRRIMKDSIQHAKPDVTHREGLLRDRGIDRPALDPVQRVLVHVPCHQYSSPAPVRV